MMKELDILPFVHNPSPLTKDLLSHCLAVQQELEFKFSGNSFIHKFINSVRLHYFYKTKYQDFTAFILQKPYKKERLFKNAVDRLQNIFYLILFNNLLLEYSAKIEKEISQPIYTKTQLFIDTLAKLKKQTIAAAEFKKLFGHYSNNEFELSAAPFAEFSDEQLQQLARFAQPTKSTNRITLEEYLAQSPKKIFPVYAALKEELKYIALQYVNDLRNILLQYSREQKVSDIFSWTYEKALNKL